MTRVVKKPEERKTDIVAAARHLFRVNGFDGTTMQDVMQELNIAKGTIYHYFTSKEELLEAVVTDIVAESTERMRRIVDNSSDCALDKIRALVSASRIADDNHELIQQLHRCANAGMHARLMAVALQQQAPLYATVFQQGHDEGVFHVEFPTETAEFILAAAEFLTDEGIYPWAKETILRRTRILPCLIEKQLGAPPGSLAFLLPHAR